VDYYALAAFSNSTETEVERAKSKVPSSIRFVGPSMPLSVDPWAVDRDRLARLLDEAKADLEQLKAAAPPTDEPLAAADGGAGGEAAGEEPLRKEASQAAVKAARQRVEQLQNRMDDLPSAETFFL